MRTKLAWIAITVVLALGSDTSASAQPRGSSNQLVLTGRVVDLHGPRLFSIRELQSGGREVFVLAPRPISPTLKGATVRVEGTLRRLTAAELKQSTTSDNVGERLRSQLAERAVLVAKSVMATLEGERAAAEVSAPAEEPSRIETAEAVRPQPAPLAIRASAVVAHLEGLAGQPLRMLHARVVGLLEPRAFLVEPATEYLKDMGTRDRMVVLIRDGALRVPAELIVGETVIVEGVVRSLLGMQVTREVPWPARLEPQTIKRLEVRGAVLATSVKTIEGVELTDRR